MKKLLIILTVVLLMGFILCSCHRHVCPAYTQADIEQAEDNI